MSGLVVINVDREEVGLESFATTITTIAPAKQESLGSEVRSEVEVDWWIGEPCNEKVRT